MADNDMTTPPGPWMEPDVDKINTPQGEVCDVCGRNFKNEHGVTMHKARAHSGRNWASRGNAKKPKPAPKRQQQQPPAPQQRVVLREVYTDGGENGRILLTDQAGNWWVARKLDV
jgi:hypothetical protein